MSRLIFFDVETTGLNPFIAEPFEFGYVIDSGPGEPREEVSFYVAPDLEDASPRAMEINDYHGRLERGELPQLVTRADAVRNLLTDLKDATMVVNSLQFDLGMTSAFIYNNAGRNTTALLHPTPWSHRSVDLKSLTAGVLGIDPREVKTGAVKRHFGLRNDGEHTALGDAWFNHDWYKALGLFTP